MGTPMQDFLAAFKGTASVIKSPDEREYLKWRAQLMKGKAEDALDPETRELRKAALKARIRASGSRGGGDAYRALRLKDLEGRMQERAERQRWMREDREKANRPPGPALDLGGAPPVRRSPVTPAPSSSLTPTSQTAGIGYDPADPYADIGGDAGASGYDDPIRTAAIDDEDYAEPYQSAELFDDDDDDEGDDYGYSSSMYARTGGKIKSYEDGGLVEDDDDDDVDDDVGIAGAEREAARLPAARDDGDDDDGDADEPAIPLYTPPAPAGGQAPGRQASAGKPVYSTTQANDAVFMGLEQMYGPEALTANAQARPRFGAPRAPASVVARQQVEAVSAQEMAELLNHVDPEKRLSDSERNMAALAAGHDYFLRRNNPQRAAQFSASMLYRMKGDKAVYDAVARAAAESGDVDGALEAGLRGYALLPDGRDFKARKIADDRYEISMIDERTGKRVKTTLATPEQILRAATSSRMGGFEDLIGAAAGYRQSGGRPTAADRRAAIEERSSGALAEAGDLLKRDKTDASIGSSVPLDPIGPAPVSEVTGKRMSAPIPSRSGIYDAGQRHPGWENQYVEAMTPSDRAEFRRQQKEPGVAPPRMLTPAQRQANELLVDPEIADIAGTVKDKPWLETIKLIGADLVETNRIKPKDSVRMAQALTHPDLKFQMRVLADDSGELTMADGRKFKLSPTARANLMAARGEAIQKNLADKAKRREKAEAETTARNAAIRENEEFHRAKIRNSYGLSIGEPGVP